MAKSRIKKKLKVAKRGLKLISTGLLVLLLIVSQGQVLVAYEAHVISVIAKIVQPCEPQELVINGSFEAPIVGAPQQWDVYLTPEVPGWDVDWVRAEPDFQGTPQPDEALLELHRGVAGWTSQDGQQHAELDTDWDGPGGPLSGEPASVKISQDLPTIPGEDYTVKYYFSPRPSTGADNNVLEFRWGGEFVATTTAVGGGNTIWIPYEYTRTATSTSTNIQFADLGTSDSLGTFLDNVSVVGCTSGDVVINEFLPNPVGADDDPMPDGEWVELYNRGGENVDVDGWVLYDDDDSHELFITSGNTDTADTIVEAGGFLVVYRDGDGDFALNNTGGDSVRLYDDEIGSGGELIDSYTYTVDAAAGKSFAQIPDGSEIWFDPIPTPGEPNVLGDYGVFEAESCDIGSIVGYKFSDTNQNGIQDEEEEGLAGWIITLEKTYDARHDYNYDGYNDETDLLILQIIADGIESCPDEKICNFNTDFWVDDQDVALYPNYPVDLGNQLTNGDGYYSFNGLESGVYLVSEVLESGWIPTNAPEQIVEIQCGEKMANFGNYRQVTLPEPEPEPAPVPEPVLGCTDETALNFDTEATEDDGSCVYEEPTSTTTEPIIVAGCTDELALNYNPEATEDDGNCEYQEEPTPTSTEPVIIPGCMDETALNYNVEATEDDGSCVYEEPTSTTTEPIIVAGCTDELALNYYPEAIEDDGTCEYAVLGCTDELATNYNVEATEDDGTCTYPEPEPVLGCTDETALNFDPDATEDDGTCEYPILGCLDPTAINYEPDATEDDGSCSYPEPEPDPEPEI